MTQRRNKGVNSKKAWALSMKAMPCTYCGKTPAGTVDHVIRLRHGGPTTPENCVPACWQCQNKRERREQPLSLSTFKLGELLELALEKPHSSGMKE